MAFSFEKFMRRGEAATANLIHHPDELDGVFACISRGFSSSPSRSPSARGGWGRSRGQRQKQFHHRTRALPFSAILCHSLPFSAIVCHCLPFPAILCHPLPSYPFALRRSVPLRLGVPFAFWPAWSPPCKRSLPRHRRRRKAVLPGRHTTGPGIDPLGHEPHFRSLIARHDRRTRPRDSQAAAGESTSCTQSRMKNPTTC
jgi:hypothetical protein